MAVLDWNEIDPQYPDRPARRIRSVVELALDTTASLIVPSVVRESVERRTVHWTKLLFDVALPEMARVLGRAPNESEQDNLWYNCFQAVIASVTKGFENIPSRPHEET